MSEELPCKIVKIKDWTQLKRRLATLPDTWLFRGQSNSAWPLTTSLERTVSPWSAGLVQIIDDVLLNEIAVTDNVDDDQMAEFRHVCGLFLDEAFNLIELAEDRALQMFKASAHHYLRENAVPQDRLEWYAMMQHHGAPTRLMDWTSSPYVAAFFAIEACSDSCAVIAIDAVWCHHQGIKKAKEKGCPESLNFSTVSPDYFEYVVSNQVDGVFPVVPGRQNERLTVQQGMFLAMGNSRKSFVDNILTCSHEEIPKHIIKFIIPESVRGEALADLYRMNISSATLFPGLDGFARSIGHRLYVEGDGRYQGARIGTAMRFDPGFAEGFAALMESAMTSGAKARIGAWITEHAKLNGDGGEKGR